MFLIICLFQAALAHNVNVEFNEICEVTQHEEIYYGSNLQPYIVVDSIERLSDKVYKTTTQTYCLLTDDRALMMPHNKHSDIKLVPCVECEVLKRVEREYANSVVLAVLFCGLLSFTIGVLFGCLFGRELRGRGDRMKPIRHAPDGALDK